MTGAFIDALGVLLGALFGLLQREQLSARVQNSFCQALGAAAVFVGLRLVWLHINGTFLGCAKQVFIALTAIVLGHWLGRLLRLQEYSNRLGRRAGNLIAATKTKSAATANNGFIACTILFCAAPLGWLGAATDGLGGDFYLLALKAVMDALAAAGFIKMFGWPAALSAFPVYAFLGALTLACQYAAKPFLDAHGLTDIVNVTAGFVACVVALVILEVRKVELANYLPSLAVAPLLAWLFR